MRRSPSKQKASTRQQPCSVVTRHGATLASQSKRANRSKVQGPKSKVQSPKSKCLSSELQDLGLWTLDFGPWTLDFGLTSAGQAELQKLEAASTPYWLEHKALGRENSLQRAQSLSPGQVYLRITKHAHSCQ